MKQQNLTSGNVLSVIITFTIPILLSMLLQIAYGTADLFIVGQFSDVANVSGVSIGSQLTQVFTSFCVGLSMGTTVLIGRYMGEDHKEAATKVVGVSIYLFTIIALVGTILMMGMSGIFTTLMQTPEESYLMTKTYLLITGAGTVFIVAYNVLGSIFRGIGDSKTPLIAVAIACMINIILDLILVAGFNMGASGAAIATVVAQGFSVLISLVLIRKKGLPFAFSKSDVKRDKDVMVGIVKIGIPTAMHMVLSGFSFLIISAILNSLGVAASAAVGIVSKIVSFILVIPQAFGQSLSAYTAQNLGANRMDRARKGLWIAIGLSLVYGVGTGYLSYFHGNIFTQVFNPDTATNLAALDYLKAYAPDCLLVAFVFTFAGYYNGCGRTTMVMINGVAGAFLIRIPLSYYFSTLDNTTLFLIGLAIPISTVGQNLWYLITYAKDLRKER